MIIMPQAESKPEDKAALAPSALALDRQGPYLLALLYSIAVSAFVAFFFDPPPPRFMDLYLIGTAFFAARWSSGPALLIYFFSVMFCWWLLPPRGAFIISEGHEVYRMLSYSAVAICIILVIGSVKQRG